MKSPISVSLLSFGRGWSLSYTRVEIYGIENSSLARFNPGAAVFVISIVTGSGLNSNLLSQLEDFFSESIYISESSWRRPTYARPTVIGDGLSVTRFFKFPLVTLASISLKRPSASDLLTYIALIEEAATARIRAIEVFCILFLNYNNYRINQRLTNKFS